MMWSGMTLEPPSERWLTGEPAASRTLRKSPLITTASLKSYSTKDLAQLAKRQGVAGWHSMNKVQLVRALGRVAKPKAAVRKKSALKSSLKTAKHGNGHRLVSRASATRATVSRPSSNGHKANGDAKANGHPNPNGQAKSNGEAKRPARKKAKNLFVAKRIQRAHENQERRKDLSGMLYTGPDVPKNGKARPEAIRDRVVLLVRDPFWLQACWEVTRQSVLRAQAAMAEHWHTARPILRLVEVEANGTTSSTERILREIPIHGGVSNWYIDVQNPPQSYRVDLGYLAASGKFFSIARSNSVTTPRPGSADAIDENWASVAANYEKIYAQSGGFAEVKNGSELQELFEERLRRPMGSPAATRFGVGAESVLNRRRQFQFDVDAELIIFGSTRPDAAVMLSGEPVKLRPDGTFTVRMAMPDKRQVIPVVASSKDGVEQRTVVLAIERNTKVMEPMLRESQNGGD